MRHVILDASVGLAWLTDEKRPDWVDRLIADARAGTTGLAVPSLFWLEAGNHLSRDRAMADDQTIDGLLRLETLGLETVELDRPLRIRALQLGREHRLSMYDGAYLTTAATLRAPLATLDRALDAAAASLGLSYGGDPGRMSEMPAPYSRDVDPVTIASIGAVMAELRRRYATT